MTDEGSDEEERKGACEPTWEWCPIDGEESACKGCTVEGRREVLFYNAQF